MRESIGSTWIFGLVITFTLIFAGFLVLTISYSKTYKLKNEMTSIIEKYEGLTSSDKLNNLGSINIINQYLYNSGYSTKGNCNVGDYASDDLSSGSLTIINNSNSSNKYYYCISLEKNNDCTANFIITLFYNFNLPVFGQLKKYSVKGKTNTIHNAYILDTEITC